MSEHLMKHETHNVAETAESRVRKVSPACDVYENADEYLITAEMPGVREADVDLRLDRTRLAIEAERPLSGATEGQPTAVRYVRVFEIPETIDRARIGAKLQDGVLSVHLPKAPQARVREIAVTAG